MSDVTRILSAIEQGDPQAAEQLLPLVYDELRQLAATKMAQEKPGQTLQATALVHEAYLRLVDVDTAAAAGTAAATSLPPRPRPCAASSSNRPAASAGSNTAANGERVDLRLGLLDDRAHRRWTCCAGRGPGQTGGREPAKAELVKLRFFAGLTMPEAAAALGISLATANATGPSPSRGCTPNWPTTPVTPRDKIAAAVRGSPAACRTVL